MDKDGVPIKITRAAFEFNRAGTYLAFDHAEHFLAKAAKDHPDDRAYRRAMEEMLKGVKGWRKTTEANIDREEKLYVEDIDPTELLKGL